MTMLDIAVVPPVPTVPPAPRAVATAPEVKLVALTAFVVAVVATPPQAMWAFGVFAGIVALTARVAHVRPRRIARRLVFDMPFVLFAAALPFIGGDPVTIRWGMTWSVPGSWAAWNILAKATLCTAAAVIVHTTTPAADLIDGLKRLGAPAVLVAIASFMIRYVDVVGNDLQNMEYARLARGGDPTTRARLRAMSATVGCVFLRTYARGERVHNAMLARGQHAFVRTKSPRAPRAWFPTLVLPLTAIGVCIAAHLIT